jgi:ABC-type polysaccharide/polyol phosphate transport system ATPase subunit
MTSKEREVSVQLTGITKTYTIHHEKPTFIEQVFRSRDKEQFNALNNVDLTIYKGEKVGIIGHNGSGKTTILKIISGITSPTKGKVVTNGKVVSLIDLTAGFHSDLTGEENIFLNGLIVGMSKNEVLKKINEIITFADIGKFIDAPLYTYSEGMKLRLGFSIAVHADPDILVLDEGISTGDTEFQEKSKNKIQEFFKQGRTIIIVSHWLAYLRDNCDRFIHFKLGNINQDGGEEVIDRYNKKS